MGVGVGTAVNVAGAEVVAVFDGSGVGDAVAVWVAVGVLVDRVCLWG